MKSKVERSKARREKGRRAGKARRVVEWQSEQGFMQAAWREGKYKGIVSMKYDSGVWVLRSLVWDRESRTYTSAMPPLSFATIQDAMRYAKRITKEGKKEAGSQGEQLKMEL